MMEDPHLLEQGALRPVNHPELGPMKLFGSPLRFNGESAVGTALAPTLGADNDDFCSCELGLSAEEMKQLRRERAI